MKRLIEKLGEGSVVTSGFEEEKKYQVKKIAGAMAAAALITHFNPLTSTGKKNFDEDTKKYSAEEKKVIRDELNKIRKELFKRR